MARQEARASVRHVHRCLFDTMNSSNQRTRVCTYKERTVLSSSHYVHAPPAHTRLHRKGRPRSPRTKRQNGAAAKCATYRWNIRRRRQNSARGGATRVPCLPCITACCIRLKPRCTYARPGRTTAPRRQDSAPRLWAGSVERPTRPAHSRLS